MCPANTYSPGYQTVLIDGIMGDFKTKNYPREVQFKCSVDPIGQTNENLILNQDSEVCQVWAPTKRGIKAFRNTIENSFVNFDIEYPAYFESQGLTTFRYFKDSAPTSDKQSPLSVFTFYVDDIPMLIDQNTTSSSNYDS